MQAASINNISSINKVAPRRIASTIINALKGGVVPRVGLQYIAVGRMRETEALLHDTEIIADGGATFRFIVGRYGSGKSFLLQMVRNYAMDRGFAVCDCDLSPERRFCGSDGQGLATYRELINNMSVGTKPDGGALPFIIDKWIAATEAQCSLTATPDTDEFNALVKAKIMSLASELTGMVNGFDFARVIEIYWNAHKSGDDNMKSNALRWLRGEYASKTECRNALGLRTIIDDGNWYEALKLITQFIVKIEYKGLIVLIDELVNLFRIPFRVTREYNYEKLLAIYNDTLQGKAHNIGFIMVSTPQSLEDPDKGVFSYEALRSRLVGGAFSEGVNDMMSPLIRIEPLTQEELYVLLENVASVHHALYGAELNIAHDDYIDFLKMELENIGATTFVTPRSIIRDFIEALNRISQDRSLTISRLVRSKDIMVGSDEAANGGDYADFDL